MEFTVKVAMPALRAAVPSSVPPSTKVTMPVGKPAAWTGSGHSGCERDIAAGDLRLFGEMSVTVVAAWLTVSIMTPIVPPLKLPLSL